MNTTQPADGSSWFGSTAHHSHDRAAPPGTGDPGYARLWSVFMMARVAFAAALLVFHSVLRFGTHMTTPWWVWWLSGCYFIVAVLVRWRVKPRERIALFDVQWIYAVGIDLAFFAVLLLARPSAISYAPLFALPVLVAAVLGSRLQAAGSAALVTVLLLGEKVLTETDNVSGLAQVGLAGAGLLALAWLTNLLSMRLTREESRARASRAEAQLQAVVSSMVIENLPYGVLVVDSDHVVQAANPAAHAMLGLEDEIMPRTFGVGDDPAWLQLAQLVQRTLSDGPVEAIEIILRHSGRQFSRLQVRTQRTPALGELARPLCVLFMQDLREMEARLRTEKLAAMGRISAAVAHEIRNPLAAISQANDLLAEDLQHPMQQRLAGMVRQNAERLGHIVDDVLDVVRVGAPGEGAEPREVIALDTLAASICDDWIGQHQAEGRVLLDWRVGEAEVRFNAEHLRRVLVNLLDNAARYASNRQGAIQVATQTMDNRHVMLLVWSDGAAMESGVWRHLFEPFFSSESRSSGLGLFICRELCQRHGAEIAYARTQRVQNHKLVEGNEFFLSLQSALPAEPLPLAETKKLSST